MSLKRKKIYSECDTQAFFDLLKAGLWQRDVRLSAYNNIEFNQILRFAEEQAVTGLIAAGLEHLVDIKVPQNDLLIFVGYALKIEQRNKAMNTFIADLVNQLSKNEVCVVLVKGQGIAQCYDRPLWRVAGDIDLFLDETSYQKAKALLLPQTTFYKEDERRLHLELTINSWLVELHGTMHTDISRKINRFLDEVQAATFNNGGIRVWKDSGVVVKLPNADNDVIIIFTHIINHFYGEGIGLRQICDLARLLWKYNGLIDTNRLRERIVEMGLEEEWKSFGSFIVDYLGMQKTAVPLYSDKKRYHKKAMRIRDLIIETGSFGKNKDNSYRLRKPKLLVDTKTFFRRFNEFARLTTIFPDNAPRFFMRYINNRARALRIS